MSNEVAEINPSVAGLVKLLQLPPFWNRGRLSQKDDQSCYRDLSATSWDQKLVLHTGEASFISYALNLTSRICNCSSPPNLFITSTGYTSPFLGKSSTAPNMHKCRGAKLLDVITSPSGQSVSSPRDLRPRAHRGAASRRPLGDLRGRGGPILIIQLNNEQNCAVNVILKTRLVLAVRTAVHARCSQKSNTPLSEISE